MGHENLEMMKLYAAFVDLKSEQARRAAEGLALRGMATVRTPTACRSRSVAGSPYPRSAVTDRGTRPARRAIRLIAGASWGASGGLPAWTP